MNAVKWKPWQQEVLNIINTEPNDRDVHWYYEEKGNVGKTFLTKYLVETYNALIVDCKLNHIRRRVAYRCDNNQLIEIVVFDIPRASAGRVSYEAIEMLKNGRINAGKYGSYRFKSPHVIVFAVCEPNYSKMSMDRWKVKKIE